MTKLQLVACAFAVLLMMTVLTVADVRADAKQNFWLLGDSLSSPSDSWANQLDDDGYATISNLSQAGLTLVDSDLPRYLKCNADTKVIIWLGTNDAGSLASLKLFERTLIDHLAFLEGRKCKVFLLEPLTLDHFESSTVKAHAQDVIRLVRKHAKKNPNVIRLKVPYSSNDTTDGLHPTTAQHSSIAHFMQTKLQLK